MIITFTATTRNTDENRRLMCEFINEYSAKCTQLTFRSVAGSLIIEGTLKSDIQEMSDLCKKIPAKVVVWNGSPILGTVIVNKK